MATGSSTASASELFNQLEKLHQELNINGVWISSNELGEDFDKYMESFGHNILTIAIMKNFMKEIHEYHFFVEELRIKIDTAFNEYSYGAKVNGKTIMMPYCYFFERTSRFYLTEDGKLGEDVNTNGEIETIIREREGKVPHWAIDREGDSLILTYKHNGATWRRTFQPATEEQILKKQVC